MSANMAHINVILEDIAATKATTPGAGGVSYRLAADDITYLTGLGYTITTDANGISRITWGA
jgi:hypothetical protein